MYLYIVYKEYGQQVVCKLEIILPTWQTMSLLVKRTTKRYLGVLYLFLSWVTRRLRAK